MDKQRIDELIKSGDPIAKLFITHEEALKIKENRINDREEDCRIIEQENKELLSSIGNVEDEVGHIMRDFEIKNPPTDSQKEYMNNLWNYFLKEIPLRLNRSKSHKKEEKKRLKKIQHHKDKIEELKNDAVHAVSEPGVKE